MLIEIFQINDLEELGVLKQRPSYVTARSPGLPVLSSHEDPSLSSCCGEISRPLSRLPPYLNTQAALSESTVLGAAMAAGNAIVLPPIFKAGDSSFPSSGSSGWPGSQAKAGRTAFILRTRAGLCFGAVGTAVLVLGCVCVLVCVEGVGVFTPAFSPANSHSCLLVHSTTMH